MLITNIKIYTEGKQASKRFHSNPDLCRNPYLENTPEWKEWNYGWNSDMTWLDKGA